MIITGDFTDNDWLLLLEDDGPNGLGRVLGYLVFETEAEAEHFNKLGLGYATDACDLFVGEELPRDGSVQTEVMSYADFKTSYGNRMPLVNRGRGTVNNNDY